MFVNYFNLFIAIFGIAVTLACMLWPGIIIKKRQYISKHMEMILGVNFLYLLAVALESYYQGRAGGSPYLMMNLAVFMEYVSLYSLSLLVMLYLAFRIKENGLAQLDVRPFLCIYVIAFAFVGINFFTGMYYRIGADNVYYRGDYVILAELLGLLCHLSAWLLYLKHRKELKIYDRYFLLPFLWMPLIALVLQMPKRGINVMALATTMCCLILIMESFIFWKNVTIEKMEELRQMELAVKFGYIRQEFFQNILADISQLCKMEPMKASVVIDQFSEYLRKSLDDMNRPATASPFSEELKHLENYLSLEIIRYGEDLDVSYDIEETEFEIPTQVLVRTADIILKYSMEKSEDIFSMTVHSCKTEEGYLVEFYEDNLGKNPVRNQTEEELLDLEDIRSRLKMLPHARLEYDNLEDYGVTIKIYL